MSTSCKKKLSLLNVSMLHNTPPSIPHPHPYTLSEINFLSALFSTRRYLSDNLINIAL